MFKKVEIRELTNRAWMSDHKDVLAPNVVALARRFNDVSFWVGTEIVRPERLDARKRALVKFIEVAAALREISNFNGLFEVMSGLANAAVYRLRRTWDAVPVAHQRTVKELQDLTAPFFNFKKYLEALNATKPPCIPYLGAARGGGY
jgi:son of sevenless